MADPSSAAGRAVGEKTDVALDGVPETAVDRIESALLAELDDGTVVVVGAWLYGERPA